jgi:hypothetical protein
VVAADERHRDERDRGEHDDEGNEERDERHT